MPIEDADGPETYQEQMAELRKLTFAHIEKLKSQGRYQPFKAGFLRRTYIPLGIMFTWNQDAESELVQLYARLNGRIYQPAFSFLTMSYSTFDELPMRGWVLDWVMMDLRRGYSPGPTW